MTERVVRLLFPFSLIVAAALWARGYAAVGDGFSAGAIAGLGAVAQYVGLDHEGAGAQVGARWAWQLMVAGLLLVLLVLLGPVVAGYPPVTHFPRPGVEPARLGTLEVHSAALFDLGTAALVYGALVGVFDRLFPPFGKAAR